MSAYILIAEDEPIVCELLETLFEEEGYQVQLARDGEEALTHIEQRRPDLLMLDLMMPRRDGFELLRELRERDWYMPVIILTASSVALRMVARQYPGNTYLSKPLDVIELLDCVRRLLAHQNP